MVLATLTSFCVRCPTRERSGFYDDMVGEGGGACQRALSLSPPPYLLPGKKKGSEKWGGSSSLICHFYPSKA